jgi:hypothetical protein
VLDRALAAKVLDRDDISRTIHRMDAEAGMNGSYLPEVDTMLLAQSR